MIRNFSRNLKILLFLMLAVVVVLTAACGKTVVRENILSSIESGVGITVNQNKQTQMYEVKAGFIRSQFYSIPTGKVVESDASVFTDISTCRKIASIPIGDITSPERAKVFSLLSSCVHEKKTQTSNAANLTPELVSGIRAHTGWEDLFLGMDVSESFAVGKVAVMSPAAVAMYITMADDSKKSDAAVKAVNSFEIQGIVSRDFATKSEKIIPELYKKVDLLDKKSAVLLATNPPATNDNLEAVIAAMDPSNQRSTDEKAAKTIIKRRIVLGEKNIDYLEKWEKALDAYYTSKEN